MSNLERIIGTLEEFKKAQQEHNRINREEHREMMRSLEEHSKLRWKIHGAYMTIAAIIGAVGSKFLNFFSS